MNTPDVNILYQELLNIHATLKEMKEEMKFYNTKKIKTNSLRYPSKERVRKHREAKKRKVIFYAFYLSVTIIPINRQNKSCKTFYLYYKILIW